jgi:septal ring factor EnvC (AmiA/AmiB activator)
MTFFIKNHKIDLIVTFLGFLVGNLIVQFFVAPSLAEGIFKSFATALISICLYAPFSYLLARQKQESLEKTLKNLEEQQQKIDKASIDNTNLQTAADELRMSIERLKKKMKE